MVQLDSNSSYMGSEILHWLSIGSGPIYNSKVGLIEDVF